MHASDVAHTGSTLYGRDGSKVGTVTDVVLEATTLEPEWYEVKVGMLGHRRFVPAASVRLDGERCTVPYGKGQVRSAPATSVPPLEHEKEYLLQHYRTG